MKNLLPPTKLIFDKVVNCAHLHPAFSNYVFFLQGRCYLKNRQKPTATLIYTDNIMYNIYTTYIPPPPIINTFSDVKIH